MSDERIVRIQPAFHRCDAPGNGGIGGVAIWFCLKRDGAAITWTLLTDWGQTDEAFKAQSPLCTHHRHQDGYPRMDHRRDETSAIPGAIAWHYPHTVEEGGRPCEWLDGAPCAGDIGFLIGESAFDTLRDGGDEALWAYLGELLDDAGHNIS